MGLGGVLGAGRVEQRSNGGGWEQGVCRGQSSNREAPGVCEGAKGIEGSNRQEKRQNLKKEVEKKENARLTKAEAVMLSHC